MRCHSYRRAPPVAKNLLPGTKIGVYSGMLHLAVRNMIHVVVAGVACAVILVGLHAAERRASRYLAWRLGWRSVRLTGWLGVPIHEFSHLVAAKIFGHRVIAWKLYDPDPVSGTLGYVRHGYRRRSAWQILGTFPIAIAPVVGGGCALLALSLVIFGADFARVWAAAWQHAAAAGEILAQGALGSGIAHLAASGRILARGIWQSPTPWWPVGAYAGVAISTHLAPSYADLRGGWPGGLALTAAALLGAAILAALGINAAAVFLLPTALGVVALVAMVGQGSYVTLVALAFFWRRKRSRRHVSGRAPSG